MVFVSDLYSATINDVFPFRIHAFRIYTLANPLLIIAEGIIVLYETLGPEHYNYRLSIFSNHYAYSLDSARNEIKFYEKSTLIANR